MNALALWSVLALAHPDHDLSHTADVVIDARSTDTGWLALEATYHDLDPRELAFRRLARPEEIEIADVRFIGANGPIEATWKEPHWTLVDPPPGPIRVTWRARPGGEGRHGRQGWLAPDWAVFDGRVLLLPSSRRSVRTMRFKVLQPAGWSIVHPWEEHDGWLVAHDARHLKSIVTAACVAIGDYEVRDWTFGGTELRVGAPRSFPDAHREQLFEKSSAMFGWFHEQLGFDRRAPFAIAWTPDVDGGRVFGGASVNGACYEHPRDMPRNWLLLGHRIGHPMNKYTPSGMSLRDPRDAWFMEGWASYIEVVAAGGSGVLPGEAYWNTLYRRYLQTLATEPELDVPLAEEREHHAAHEYLHYTKGPLVVKQLDALMRSRSGTDMERFMRAMWAKYGFHARAFPLREEIEAFTGDDYDDFWAMSVDRVGHVIPTWAELVDGSFAQRAEVEPAAWVGDVAVHPEYLFWLAWSGEFTRYADIVEFLEAAAHRERLLAERGLALLPPTLGPHRFSLPAQALYALDRSAIDWPLDAVPARRGCGGGDPAPQRIRWSDSPVSRTFQELLTREREYEGDLGRSVGAITFTVERAPRLAVGPHDRIVVHTAWVAPPPRVGVELTVDGEATHVRRLTLDPTWTTTRAVFEPEHRPKDASILLMRVGPDTVPQIGRPLWQASMSFTRPDPSRRPPAEPEPDEDQAGSEPSTD